MPQIINGYKCFDLDNNGNLVNRYGKKFNVGEQYSVTGEIRFGNSGNGFHMCKNFEDTLRYFDAIEKAYNEPEGIVICEVVGSGENILYEDDYYGYYDMYSCKNLEITRIITREELLTMARNLYEERFLRFAQLFQLSDDERTQFTDKYNEKPHVVKLIKYYQERKY